ncbi:MAG: hypothetical protein ACOC2W_00785 [bacterium]
MLFEYIKNKSIAIIGNSQSLYDNNWFDQINKYDIVVRMNFGISLKSDQMIKTTKRCEIYAENQDAICLRNYDKYNTLDLPKYKILVSHYSRHIDNIDVDYVLSDEYLDRYKIELGRKPSTGYRLIRLFIDFGNFKQLGIFGFDFFSTPNFFNPKLNHSAHDPDREQYMLFGYINDDSKIIYYNPKEN